LNDIWFIFDNLGQLLYLTYDIERSILHNINPSYNATYVIKNPTGYNNKITQQISYNTQSNNIIISNIQTVEEFEDNISENEDGEMPDYSSLAEDIQFIKTKLAELENTLNEMHNFPVVVANVDLLKDQMINVENVTHILTNITETNTGVLNAIFT